MKKLSQPGQRVNSGVNHSDSNSRQNEPPAIDARKVNPFFID